MPTPSYSPTDYGAAVGALALMVVDVLTGLGVISALDAPTRTALMTSVTFLAGLLIAAYVANRRVKHQAQASVATAQVTAVPPAAAVVAAPHTPFATSPMNTAPAPPP